MEGYFGEFYCILLVREPNWRTGQQHCLQHWLSDEYDEFGGGSRCRVDPLA